MPLDRALDPVTRDYIDDGKGGYVETATAQTKIYHQIYGHLNSFPGAPDRGCRLYLLQREKDDDITLHRAVDYTNEAYAPLVEAAFVDNVVVDTERNEIGRLVVSTTARDVQNGQLPTMPFTPGGI